jgi:hypothetical protein
MGRAGFVGTVRFSTRGPRIAGGNVLSSGNAGLLPGTRRFSDPLIATNASKAASEIRKSIDFTASVQLGQ